MSDEEITPEEAEQYLWDLYVVHCTEHDQKPTVKDFIQWKQEEGYDEYA